MRAGGGNSSRTRRSASTPAPSGPVACLAVKPDGKPDAGNRHVRFDEGDGKRGDGQKAQATAPILDSTETDMPMQSPDVRCCGMNGPSSDATQERPSKFRAMRMV